MPGRAGRARVLRRACGLTPCGKYGSVAARLTWIDFCVTILWGKIVRPLHRSITLRHSVRGERHPACAMREPAVMARMAPFLLSAITFQLLQPSTRPYASC